MGKIITPINIVFVKPTVVQGQEALHAPFPTTAIETRCSNLAIFGEHSLDRPRYRGAEDPGEYREIRRPHFTSLEADGDDKRV
ncbi:hypothetical protein O3P69_000717 [Scylla paramamosain]|uniref:Uncharacterized protein n=1 Tax=Scylla paramamosain TaxID=85552 RepID=A0AAW0UU11_SCYPA